MSCSEYNPPKKHVDRGGEEDGCEKNEECLDYVRIKLSRVRVPVCAS